MTESTDPLAALDFTPVCAWGEGKPATHCGQPARFGYVWTCGCASVYCGEHDAQVNRSATVGGGGVMVMCPKHGVVRRYSRESLAVTP